MMPTKLALLVLKIRFWLEQLLKKKRAKSSFLKEASSYPFTEGLEALQHRINSLAGTFEAPGASLRAWIPGRASI